MTKAEIVVRQFNKRFPDIKGVAVRDDNQIFLGNAAEGGEINEIPAADYYGDAMDPQEKIWVFGVHKEIIKFLEDRGWFAEWYDPGTLFAYPI